MAGMLELSDQEFKTTFNMLRTLINNFDNLQEQVGNVSREMEILRKNQKKCQRSKTVNKIKNASNEVVTRLDMAEKRILKLEDMSTETSKT